MLIAANEDGLQRGDGKQSDLGLQNQPAGYGLIRGSCSTAQRTNSRDRFETLFRNQASSNLRPFAVEVVRAVTRFANAHDL